MSVTRQVNVDIVYTADQIAEIFCAMDAVEQGEFFARCHTIMSGWHALGYPTQVEAITNDLPSGGAFFIKFLIAHLEEPEA